MGRAPNHGIDTGKQRDIHRFFFIYKRFVLRELKNMMEEYHRVLTSLCQAGFHLKEVLKRILLGVERITEQTCYVWKLDSFVSAYIFPLCFSMASHSLPA